MTPRRACTAGGCIAQYASASVCCAEDAPLEDDAVPLETTGVEVVEDVGGLDARDATPKGASTLETPNNEELLTGICRDDELVADPEEALDGDSEGTLATGEALPPGPEATCFPKEFNTLERFAEATEIDDDPIGIRG